MLKYLYSLHADTLTPDALSLPENNHIGQHEYELVEICYRAGPGNRHRTKLPDINEEVIDGQVEDRGNAADNHLWSCDSLRHKYSVQRPAFEGEGLPSKCMTQNILAYFSLCCSAVLSLAVFSEKGSIGLL